jgi:hypothetical protein
MCSLWTWSFISLSLYLELHGSIGHKANGTLNNPRKCIGIRFPDYLGIKSLSDSERRVFRTSPIGSMDAESVSVSVVRCSCNWVANNRTRTAECCTGPELTLECSMVCSSGETAQSSAVGSFSSSTCAVAEVVLVPVDVRPSLCSWVLAATSSATVASWSADHRWTLTLTTSSIK